MPKFAKLSEIVQFAIEKNERIFTKKVGVKGKIRTRDLQRAVTACLLLSHNYYIIEDTTSPMSQQSYEIRNL